jgi:ubiquinone/menaquinone biosynthesis C-methylase UbiE
MQAQEYWNKIGSQKEFEDPLYLDKLSDFLTPESRIIEYGCGYGRLMQILHTNNYQNLMGFDFAQNMIERGKKLHPHLDMYYIERSGVLPVSDGSVDAIFMSTVLCCVPDDETQVNIIAELSRVLKSGGVLYLSDFLISDDPISIQKYAKGLEEHGVMGIYTTTDNLTVRHFTTSAIMELLKDFDIQWFEQFNFKTMNQNRARTFHCVAKKF